MLAEMSASGPGDAPIDGAASSLRLAPIVASGAAEASRLLRAAGLPSWGEPAVIEQLAQAGAHCVGAFKAGGLCGVLLTRTIPGELEVLALAVAARARRQGIGSALLDRALELARAGGAEALILELREHNEAARALYSKAGLVVVGRRPRYYPGGEDALLMTCRLEGAMR